MTSEYSEMGQSKIDKADVGSWWKAKLKDTDGGEEGGVGLIPVSYVEEVSLASQSLH